MQLFASFFIYIDKVIYMYDYVVKTFNGRTLYFFMENGICVKDLSSKSNRYNVIFEDGVNDFCVEDLGFGEVGIICQDKEGSIVFLRENNNTFIKTILLKSKSQKCYDKFFKLCLHGNWLGLSYIVEYNDHNILSYQLVNNEHEPPMVVDYITDKNYFTTVDKSYNRIFVYNKNEEFGYRIFKWSQKCFDNYEKLDSGSMLCATNDFSDNYYILYQKEGEVYLKVLKEEDGIFSISDYPLKFAECDDEFSVLIEESNLWIVTKRKGFIFGRKTKVPDINFSSQYNFFQDGDIRKINLSLNDKKVKTQDCFGTIKNLRPELILYKNLYNYEINKRKNSDTDEKNSYLKEIEKLNIRIALVENQLKKWSKKDS